jgi:hypothetical protein
LGFLLRDRDLEDIQEKQVVPVGISAARQRLVRHSRNAGRAGWDFCCATETWKTFKKRRSRRLGFLLRDRDLEDIQEKQVVPVGISAARQRLGRHSRKAGRAGWDFCCARETWKTFKKRRSWRLGFLLRETE